MIYTAVIPVAGMGTRVLPLTKSQPKEMLPVGRKPLVQHVVEEMVSNGIKQMLFVTGRSKTAIENHFDSDPELIRNLTAGEKFELLKEIDFGEIGAKIAYTRQPVQRGLGDAVLCAEGFVRDRPFVVALGDSILGLNGKSDTVSRMIKIFEKHQADCVIAVQDVPRADTKHYGILSTVQEGDDLRITDIVEKPLPQNAPSTLAVAGRYAFSPLIFAELREVVADKLGEIQLTDAIKSMCKAGKKVYAVKLAADERRYDVGNFPSYYETFLSFALADPEHGAMLKDKLRRMLDS